MTDFEKNLVLNIPEVSSNETFKNIFPFKVRYILKATPCVVAFVNFTDMRLDLQYEACFDLYFTDGFNYRLAHTFIWCLCNIIHLTASLHENPIGFHYTTFDSTMHYPYSNC